MTKRLERLIEKASFINLRDGRILIHIPSMRKYKAKDIVLDEEKNKGKDPLKDEMEVKEVDKEFNYKYQVGYVVGYSDDVEGINPGDKVLVKVHSLDEFDYMKGVNIIRKYDIVGVFNEGQ